MIDGNAVRSAVHVQLTESCSRSLSARSWRQLSLNRLLVSAAQAVSMQTELDFKPHSDAARRTGGGITAAGEQ